MTARAGTWSLSQFTTSTLVLMAVAIAINIAIGYVVQNVLRLPIYLDSIGTILVGVLGGPLAGAVTGALANVIWGLTIGPSTITPFAITAFVIGLLAGWFGSLRWFATSRGVETWIRVAIAGLVTGFIAAVVSAPIAYFVFGGVTGGGTDVLVAFFRGVFDNILIATFAQGVVSDPIDKLASFLVCLAILVAVPATVKTTFPQGEKTL